MGIGRYNSEGYKDLVPQMAIAEIEKAERNGNCGHGVLHGDLVVGPRGGSLCHGCKRVSSGQWKRPVIGTLNAATAVRRHVRMGCLSRFRSCSIVEMPVQLYGLIHSRASVSPCRDP